MKVGTKVQVQGLVKAAKYNGKIGSVIKSAVSGHRIGVKLDDCATVLSIKPENLREIKERTLKRDNALLREFDGSPDRNVLVLYYHFADRAFDCFNAPEYIVQMLRYYDKGFYITLIAPRQIGGNEYFLIGLQHSERERNPLCEVAFNSGRSFTGISMLVKKRCFGCHKPMNGESACEDCRCVCFCSDSSCAQRNADVRRQHESLCKKVDLSAVTVEDESVQLI